MKRISTTVRQLAALAALSFLSACSVPHLNTAIIGVQFPDGGLRGAVSGKASISEKTVSVVCMDGWSNQSQQTIEVPAGRMGCTVDLAGFVAGGDAYTLTSCLGQDCTYDSATAGTVHLTRIDDNFIPVVQTNRAYLIGYKVPQVSESSLVGWGSVGGGIADTYVYFEDAPLPEATLAAADLDVATNSLHLTFDCGTNACGGAPVEVRFQGQIVGASTLMSSELDIAFMPGVAHQMVTGEIEIRVGSPSYREYTVTFASDYYIETVPGGSSIGPAPLTDYDYETSGGDHAELQNWYAQALDPNNPFLADPIIVFRSDVTNQLPAGIANSVSINIALTATDENGKIVTLATGGTGLKDWTLVQPKQAKTIDITVTQSDYKKWVETYGANKIGVATVWQLKNDGNVLKMTQNGKPNATKQGADLVVTTKYDIDKK